MPTINITHEAREILRQESRTGKLAGDSLHLPDGTWNIYLESDTLERMDSKKLAGESYSDLIIRIFATQKGTN